MSQIVPAPSFMSPLHEMTETTPTTLWNDSASVAELTYAMAHGAVGATCNPVIAVDILRKELLEWRPVLERLIIEHRSATEDQLGWMMVEEVSRKAAALLEPVYVKESGRNGRLSIQTDPRLYRDERAMLKQAERLNEVAPNIIIKVAATEAGIAAIEEASYRGISVNATVSFTLPQCIAAAEAMERGLRRREQEGKDISSISPVCTIMVGRLDDWLKVVADREGITIDPGYLEWAGVAVFKKAYAVFQERGYRARLLSAAFRNHMHWSELIGGDLIVSPPVAWQKRFNASDIKVVRRIGNSVDPQVVEQLLKYFPDFSRAYSERGLSVPEFDQFAPTRRTLRQFIAATVDLASLVRDVMIPDPDKS